MRWIIRNKFFFGRGPIWHWEGFYLHPLQHVLATQKCYFGLCFRVLGWVGVYYGHWITQFHIIVTKHTKRGKWSKILCVLDTP